MTVSTNVEVILKARDDASAVFKKFSNNIQGSSQKLGQSMQRTGTAMIKIGAAPTLALVGATKAAIDFESSFAGIRKTVELSEEGFAQLSDNIRQIAKVTPVSVNELNRIGELAGQLGVEGVDNITKFTNTISQIAVTTNLTTEEAATSFARIANIMQEPIENVDRMGAVVVDLGNNFATTEREITEFGQRIAGAGKIAGLSTDQILAIGAAMSSVGVKAEAGGTSVQKVLIGMTQAVAEGGAELEVFAETAGKTGEEFKQAFEKDAAGAFESFVLGLGTQGDKAFTTLEDLGLNNQRVIRSMLSLANAGDLVTRALDTGSSSWEENIALQEEADKRFGTTASQMAIVKNNLMDVGIVIGSALLPPLIKLLKAITPVITKFANFADKHPKIVAGALLIGAAIGVIGTALLAIGIMIPAVGLMVAGIGAVGTALAGVGTAIAVVVGFIGLPILLIGALVIGLAILFKIHFNTIKNIVTGLGLWFNDVVLPIVDSVVSSIIGFFVKLKDNIEFVITAITEKFVNFFTITIPAAIATLVNFLTVTIPAAVAVTIDWFTKLPRRIGDALYQLAFNDIPFAIGFILTVFEEFFTITIPAIIASFIEFITVTIPAFLLQMWEWFKAWAISTGKLIWEFATVTIPEAFAAMIKWLKINIPIMVANFIEWITDLATSSWNAIVQFKDDAIETLTTFVKNAIAKVVELHHQFVDWIIALVQDAIKWVWELPGNILEAFEKVRQSAVNKAEEIYNGVAGWFKKIVNFFNDIKDAAGRALEKAKEAFRFGRDSGQSNQTGGIVSGPIGSAVPILAHAGERILPVGVGAGSSVSAGGTGASISFEVNIGLYAGAETEKRNVAKELYNALLSVAQLENKTVQELMGG